MDSSIVTDEKFREALERDLEAVVNVYSRKWVLSAIERRAALDLMGFRTEGVHVKRETGAAVMDTEYFHITTGTTTDMVKVRAKESALRFWISLVEEEKPKLKARWNSEGEYLYEPLKIMDMGIRQAKYVVSRPDLYNVDPDHLNTGVIDVLEEPKGVVKKGGDRALKSILREFLKEDFATAVSAYMGQDMSLVNGIESYSGHPDKYKPTLVLENLNQRIESYQEEALKRAKVVEQAKLLRDHIVEEFAKDTTDPKKINLAFQEKLLYFWVTQIKTNPSEYLIAKSVHLRKAAKFYMKD